MALVTLLLHILGVLFFYREIARSKRLVETRLLKMKVLCLIDLGEVISIDMLVRGWSEIYFTFQNFDKLLI